MTHGAVSSILSDWDDFDGQSGSNYQHNYFYNKSKKKRAGISGTNRKNKKGAGGDDAMRD